MSLVRRSSRLDLDTDSAAQSNFMLLQVWFSGIHITRELVRNIEPTPDLPSQIWTVTVYSDGFTEFQTNESEKALMRGKGTANWGVDYLHFLLSSFQFGFHSTTWLKSLFFFPFFFFFLPHCASCRILLPPTGDRTWALAVKAPSPNHGTAREFPPEITLLQATSHLFIGKSKDLTPFELTVAFFTVDRPCFSKAENSPASSYLLSCSFSESLGSSCPVSVWVPVALRWPSPLPLLLSAWQDPLSPEAFMVVFLLSDGSLKTWTLDYYILFVSQQVYLESSTGNSKPEAYKWEKVGLAQHLE